MENRYKVLVVDDSAFMRRIITDLLNSDSSLEVIDTARDGKDCLNKLEKLNPDVITLDIEMPGMSGLEVLSNIMKIKAIPVVMISGQTNLGAKDTIKALEMGAIDFIRKPSGTISLDIGQIKTEIINKVKNAAQVKLGRQTNITRLTKLEKPSPVEWSPQAIQTSNIDLEGMKKSASKLTKIVAVGTSTGGPKALQEVIPKFPKDIPAAVLIVQHMPKGFTKSLAERLNSLSEMMVKEAEDGDEVIPGVAYLAPGDYHMKIINNHGKYLIKLTQDPPISGHRPSVDYMFESVADVNLKTVGVIMTGMGHDGAEGMVKMKAKGAYNIAEDQATCVVFGMPKVAIEKKCIDKVLLLHNIADEVLRALK